MTQLELLRQIKAIEDRLTVLVFRDKRYYEVDGAKSGSFASWLKDIGDVKSSLADLWHAANRGIDAPTTEGLSRPSIAMLAKPTVARIRDERKTRATSMAMKVSK